MAERPSVFDLTPESFAELCRREDLPPFLGKQVLEWTYAKRVLDPALMTNLSARNRERLRELVDFGQGETIAEQVATDGTRKLLLGWPDRASGALPVLGQGPSRQPPSPRNASARRTTDGWTSGDSTNRSRSIPSCSSRPFVHSA